MNGETIPGAGARGPKIPPQTADALLELVRKSGLVEPGRLDDVLRDQDVLPGAAETAQRLVTANLLTGFQAQLLLRGKWRGFHVGNYRVLKPLARGGMGRVYLCEHTAMRRRVAVKMMSAAPDVKPSAVQRFRREVRAAAALDHPNIVRAYDAGCVGKLLYLAMEYIEGVTLGELVRRRGPLPVALAVHSVRQVAAGLHYAHEAGWIHRDIKPENLLITRQGVVTILDLGLARLARADTDQLTGKYGDKDILGTVDYLAPEQIQGESEIDGRADVYGLGATFYFLLTGRPPLGRGSVAQKLLGHLIGDIRPARTLRPEVPDAIDRLLQRMMAKAPRQRYPDAAAVIVALDAASEAHSEAHRAPDRPGVESRS